MTVDPKYVAKVQKTLGLTNYEFSFILGVSEKTVESWRGGWRTPQSSSATLIRLVGRIADQGQVTREELLAKVGYQV
jgi:DNA-binding transcriptional regulator YiaG